MLGANDPNAATVMQNIQSLAMQMGAMPNQQNQQNNHYNNYRPDYFEEDDELEEGQMGSKVIIDPETG